MDIGDVIGHAGHADVLDVTAFGMADHLVLLWTAPIDGERMLVGLELAPRLDRAWEPVRWGKWLADRLIEREGMPAIALSVGQVRGVPLRDLMGARAEHLELLSNVSSTYGLIRPDGSVANFEPEDLRHLELLQDAVAYVQALEAGLSPAEVIAQSRTVSKRTAEGRITRARQVGLLTPAIGRARGGELTERALNLIHKFQGDDNSKEVN